MSGRASRRAAAALLALVLAACTATGGASSSTTVAVEPSTTAPIPTTRAPSGAASFGEFAESAWALLALRSPEGLTAAGVSEQFGLRDDTLDDLSARYAAETQALERESLVALREFDRTSLPADEQVTYDAFEWYLENRIDGHDFWLHDWPVHFFITSYNQGLLGLFTETQPLENLNDVDDYISRVAQIERQVDQVIENLESAVESGILPPRYTIEPTIRQLQADTGGGNPERTAIHARLREGLEDQGLNQATISDRLALADQQIASSFIPAWEKLIAFLESIESQALDEIGLHGLPEGEAFYAQVLRTHTSTTLTAEEIHQLGLQEVERIETEMRMLFDDLGFASELPLTELRDQASAAAGFVDEGDVVAQYEALIEGAREGFAPYFPTAPESEVIVVSYPGQGAFYIAGTVDGSRPGAFHAGTGGGSVRALTMPTIAYHEAIPGHHFQIALAQEAELPAVQRFATNAGYVEGWALYAERLASEIGMYEDNAYGDIGRLELELLRAARLVVDTGIHHFGWTHAEASEELAEIMGSERYGHEIDRYVTYPGQATSYMIGLLTLLEIRQDLEDALGADYELATFHDRAIGSGNLPLDVLRTAVLGG